MKIVNCFSFYYLIIIQHTGFIFFPPINKDSIPIKISCDNCLVSAASLVMLHYTKAEAVSLYCGWYKAGSDIWGHKHVTKQQWFKLQHTC